MTELGVRMFSKISNWIPTKEQWSKAACCIQPEERIRIGKFHYQIDGISSMAGRLILRKLTKDYFQCCNKDIKFIRGRKGKPLLEEPSDHNFHVNVSHHGDYVVGATQFSSQIGVDIMTIELPKAQRSVDSYLKLMSRQFSKNEMETLNSFKTDSRKMEHFYRLWCLKESYVKAIGDGINLNLAKISFETPSKILSQSHLVTDTKFILNDSLNDNWTFEESKLDKNHIACAATVGNNRVYHENAKKFTEVDIVSVLEDLEPLDLDFNISEYWDIFNSRKHHNVNKEHEFCGN